MQQALGATHQQNCRDSPSLTAIFPQMSHPRIHLSSDDWVGNTHSLPGQSPFPPKVCGLAPWSKQDNHCPSNTPKQESPQSSTTHSCSATYSVLENTTQKTSTSSPGCEPRRSHLSRTFPSRVRAREDQLDVPTAFVFSSQVLGKKCLGTPPPQEQ